MWLWWLKQVLGTMCLALKMILWLVEWLCKYLNSSIRASRLLVCVRLSEWRAPQSFCLVHYIQTCCPLSTPSTLWIRMTLFVLCAGSGLWETLSTSLRRRNSAEVSLRVLVFGEFIVSYLQESDHNTDVLLDLIRIFCECFCFLKRITKITLLTFTHYPVHACLPIHWCNYYHPLTSLSSSSFCWRQFPCLQHLLSKNQILQRWGEYSDQQTSR